MSRIGRLIGIRVIAVSTLTILILGAAWLQTVPVNRSPIRIEDPREASMPPDFDGVLLTGSVDGSAYRVELSVAGTIPETDSILTTGSIQVLILVQNVDRPGATYEYTLDYRHGQEVNHGVPTTISGSSIASWFPLEFLRPKAFVVGLGAVLSSPSSVDFVGEVSGGGTLVLERLLVLPLGPGAWGAAGAFLAVLTFAIIMRAFRRGHPKTIA